MSNTKTSRHRSFTPASSEKKQAPKVEPITFDLYDQTFTALPTIQGLVLMEFVESTTAGGSASISALKGFLEQALGETEYARFSKLAHDPDPEKEIDIKTIGEIVGFLVEEYSQRPTTASSESDANS